MNISDTLSALSAAAGPGVMDLSFAVHLPDATLTSADFELGAETDVEGAVRITGSSQSLVNGVKVTVLWVFVHERGGYRVTVSAGSDLPLVCNRIESLILTYAPGGSLETWRIPTSGLGVESVGMVQVAQLGEILGENPIQGTPGTAKYAEGSLLRGAFPKSRQAGLLLGTILPQNHLHTYTIERLGEEALRFSAATSFAASFSSSASPIPGWSAGGQLKPAYQYTSEATWFCASLPIRQAVAAYAEHLPLVAGELVVGWNSWDYYFSTVKLEDILENMDAISADRQLSSAVKTIVVDMGWEHCWGEWQPNYRFPGGLEHLADEIHSRGFIPGIWTAPLIVHPLSYPGLRSGELFVKNEHGDPWPSPEGGQYAIDPTHPAGQAFLSEIYTRLYGAGFRFFKIDFVNALLSAPRFHDPTKGPYGALVEFFRLVRKCVGPESHILGCSLPAECGPGLADSHRTGIDIHNQWTHVEWAVDFYQLAYWQGGRIAVNDPDFLVVRGSETSLEAETNVLNPNAHHPNPPRWRRGPVFTLDEARTWAGFVSLVGGNIILSDRLAMLNQAGLELARKVTAGHIGDATGDVIGDAATKRCRAGAIPLDLADGDRPSQWLATEEDEFRLGIINWSDEPASKTFNFSEWGLSAPASVMDFWTGEESFVVDGTLIVQLAAHGSAYVTWQRQPG